MVGVVYSKITGIDSQSVDTSWSAETSQTQPEMSDERERERLRKR